MDHDQHEKQVVQEVIDYVEKTAIEKYKSGQISAVGTFLKRRVISIRITVVGGRYSYTENSSFSGSMYGSLKPHLTASKSFFSRIKNACKNKGIEVYENYSSGIDNTYFAFSVPVEYVETILNKQRLELETFTKALTTRRSDVIDKLAEAVLSNQNRYAYGTFIDKNGLYGDIDGECGGSILLFRDLGLEPLNSREKITALSKAVVDRLKHRYGYQYTLRESSSLYDFRCYIIECQPHKQKSTLSSW